MNIRISADSTCDLSPELIEKYDIRITPLYIVRDGQSLVDGKDITPDEIYAHVNSGGGMCSTAAVSVYDYTQFFRRRFQSQCRFQIGNGRIRERRIRKRSAVFSDRSLIDDKISQIQIFLYRPGRTDTDKRRHPEARQLFHCKGYARSAHACRHDDHRFPFHMSKPACVISVRRKEIRIFIQCLCKSFHTAGIAGNKSIRSTVNLISRNADMIHHFIGAGVIFHKILL